MVKTITVVLAEDHMVVRQGLRLLLEGGGDIRVVGEAKTGRDAVQMAKELRPDVVVMDIAMPLLNGIQATRQILRDHSEAKVLILSAHADPFYIDQVIRIGVAGYLVKQTSAEALAHAVRKVRSGEKFFSPSVSKYLQHSNGTRPSPKRRSTKQIVCLSSREAELLQLVAEGHGNKQIASELGISVKTVQKHRQHLMEKLDIHETAGLTRYALAHGLA
jgi:DNA-binding NarL/FixJ family response regulator